MAACPSCIAENPDGANFCNECGTPLGTIARPLSEERKVVTAPYATGRKRLISSLVW